MQNPGYLVHRKIINCHISRPKFPIALLHKPQRSPLRLRLWSSTLENLSQLMSQLLILRCTREEIFLTSKVWVDRYGYEKCRESVEESLKKLKTDYIDLMLLHQPFSDYYGAWRALEELYEEGKLRAIGISNFYPDRLVDIAAFARIRPMINQVEVHPYNQQVLAKEYMDKYGVQTEAWAPFGEGRGGLFEDGVLMEIGRKHGKTTAQVMLRWNIQRGVVVIPKSTHYERMAENFNVFDFTLDAEDMKKIGHLDKDQSSFFSHHDPSTVEWFVQVVKGQSSAS